MASQRISVRVQAEIKSMFDRGYSKKKIAESLGVCRKTVRRVLRDVCDDQMRASAERPGPLLDFDWSHLIEELNKGVPIKTLWEESGLELNYRKFWSELRKRRPVTTPVTIKLHHTPGEKAQVDFCDGVSVVDPGTGEIIKTHLFVAVLPFSSMVFAEFCLDQKLDTFLDLHSKAFDSFGGVPRYVVPDNLKSGVKRAHRYDPDTNPTYCEYANHVGFAVIPARPYSPKDKASVESHIGVIQRGFFARVRNRVFHSLFELNQELKKYIDELKSVEMKDYGVSRLERFEHEKSFLQPLPAERFERREWKTSKVHPDCHIQVQRGFYSVPYQYAGRHVRVRISQRVVEIFDEELNPLATHPRHKKKGQYSTNDKHYPEEQVGVARYEIRHGKKQAQKIGVRTTELVEELLSGPQPLRYLRRVQGILRLYTSGRAGKPAMEYAAAQALVFRKMNFTYFQSCALHFEANGAKPFLSVPTRDPNSIYLKTKQQEVSIDR